MSHTVKGSLDRKSTLAKSSDQEEKKKKILTGELLEEREKIFLYFHHRAITYNSKHYRELSALWHPQEQLWGQWFSSYEFFKVFFIFGKNEFQDKVK